MDLYLTPAERAVATFLKEDWARDCNVIDETMAFADTDQLLRVRRSVAQFESPALKKLQSAPAGDKNALEKLGAAADLSDLSEEDISQLLFVLGPAFLSGVIGIHVVGTRTPEDAESLSDLTTVRHTLLKSFTATV